MESSATAECPAAEMLAAFAAGQLGDDELARVASHLDACPRCLQAVTAPEKTPDPFIENLQRIHHEAVRPWTANVSSDKDTAPDTGPFFYNVGKDAATRDPEVFFDALTRSGLVDAEELASMRREWRAFRAADLGEFVQMLILERRLTDFQGRQLLRGKTRGWVLGDYVIQQPLGAGGIGWLYRARQRRLHRTVTLKVVPPALAKSGSALRRFQKAIEAVGRLKHPRLVAPLDAGDIDGVCFLVMDELEGHSLAEWVELNGPMRVLSAVDMIRQAAEGLAVAHDAGIIHRDLKPSSLWVEVYSSSRASRMGPGLKVLDFGLAYVSDGESSRGSSSGSQSGSHAILGTSSYTAPEQARDSRAADERSDVYSLGCILYFLLTGKGPYDGVSQVDAAGKPMDSPPLASTREPVPAALQTIYRRMIAKDPAGRYESMDDLIVDLDAFLAGTKISRRLPAWAGWTAAAAVLFIAVVIGGAMIGGTRPSEKVDPWTSNKIVPLAGPAAAKDAHDVQRKWAEGLGVPVEVKVRGVAFRLIPPGTMPLGTPAGEIDDRLGKLLPGWQWQWLHKKGPLEWPRTTVTITKPFYLSATEITVGQFRAFADEARYQTDAETNGVGGVSYSKGLFRRQNPSLNWKTPGYGVSSESLPVTQVGVADAQAFCAWLGERDKKSTFRLPTEAEWEYACRAGSGERWFWGSDSDALRDFVSAPADGTYGPHDVALKKANAFGLYDMSGNVAEWCSDAFSETAPAAVEPPGPNAGQSKGATHTIRGGAFLHPHPDGVASASRIPAPDACQDFVGFRVVMTVR